MGEAHSSRVTVAVVLVLLAACASLAGWLVYTSGEGGTAAPASVDVSKTVRDAVGNVEVSVYPERLSVMFYTNVDARCTLQVGYHPQRPEHRRTDEKWFSRQHILAVEGLLPGKVYYRLSGVLKDGSTFDEPVKEVSIPHQERVGEPNLAQAQGTPRPTPVAAASGVTAAGGATGAPPVATVTPATPAVAGQAGAGSPAGTAAVAVAQPDGTGGTPADAGGTGATLGFVPLVPGDDPSFDPLPPADPSTPLGKRALSASLIRRQYGPASIPPAERKDIEQRIDTLRQNYEANPDPVTARELSKTYLEYRQYRKALQYASEALKANPNDVETHNVRLTIFKKFGMGWKIQETYKQLLALKPDDEELRKQFARDVKIYGDHKTIGKASRVVLK